MEAQFPVLCAFTPLKPGSEKFQRIPITTNIFKLGRGEHNTVAIPYKCLSKDHCLFKKVEGDWLLQNCSYYSIKVNDNKLRKGETHKLSDQDIIKLESSNQLVYKFMSNTNTRSPKCKRRKLDENVQNDINVNKPESTRSMRSDMNKNINDTQIKLKEQILLEQSKREKEIYDEYAVCIEKLKGSKKNVKNKKALLKMRRNAQLELNKVKMEDRIASVMAQRTDINENKHSKDKPRKQNGQGDQRTSDQSEARREQDRARMKEKRELRKLRRETRRLKLDKEKKLKELEKQKLRREKQLQDELEKVNKKLMKERELHEKEMRRAEQLLNQKKEELKKVSPSTSSDSKLDMESELQCIICSELFVRATTLGCSHSFCRYCIRKWTANRKECPICRAAITSECRSIVLDSLVEKMAETADAKQKRQELVKARDDLEAKEATTTANRETQNLRFDIDVIRNLLLNENSNSESSYHSRESSLEPDFAPMDTDSGPSGFDDSDLFSDRDENGESEYDEPENYDVNSQHENVENFEAYSGESDRENEEIYDEVPANAEEEHEGNSENDGHDDENYDGGENSPTDNEYHDENDPEYNEGEESASENYAEGVPENYYEGENSGPENYDEGENSGPENYDEGENSEPDNYDEGENSSPDNYEGENSAPENYDEGEISSPENYNEGDNTEPENYDEGENSDPEDYGEGDNSAPENYDDGDYSAPEYDGDSCADDGGNDDDDDYY